LAVTASALARVTFMERNLRRCRERQEARLAA
jgi:hypothetical protein